jgi:Asp-tRNA(Asn)/Glu-tRNA(Gln) amidotransferase A subunit family amidase
VKAEQARSYGDDLEPLHGLPAPIKEQFRVKGTQTALGATNKIGNVYQTEGPLVTKLSNSRLLRGTQCRQTVMSAYVPARGQL